MTEDKSATAGRAPGAVDVVDGPVGSAWLKDPATLGPIRTDLDTLPSIDTPASPDAGGPIEGEPVRSGQEGRPG